MTDEVRTALRKEGSRVKKSMLALLVLLVPFSALGAPLHKFPGAVRERYLVLLRKDAPAATHADSLARAANGKVVHVYDTILNGFSMHATEQAAQAMAHRPEVESVWEVPTVRPTEVQSMPPLGLDRIDQRALPLDNFYIYFLDATPTTIYITDTGVDPNSDLGERLTSNINFVSDSSGNRDPNDYTDHGLPLNDVWHGTSSAVLAAGSNYGVARFAKVANVRLLGPGGGSWDDIIAGIQWVTEQAVARPAERHVANASWTAAQTFLPAESALRSSVASGVAWVFAAGNDGADACNYFPARLGPQLSGALTVGAMTPSNDTVTGYSNQGPCVEMFAPADVRWGTTEETRGTIAGGTSAAAPHAAGVFALRLAGATGSVAEIEGIVKGYATPDRLTNLWPGSPNLLLFSHVPRRHAVDS